ncbi:decapping and exoribonuclease protein-like [Acipenser ruthenus]|uniref:decapping and exoribonuclease protein-like n=1 Tax=Acipenser ruthenus TaxID=7906 RepID=UPI002741601B|nr:decapping and exoribonuclease protein-like [Acipenser ruthenus]XP_033887323.3 decapping and exoribonuclease protein-like [Acipenser ruthenus]
MSSTLSVINSQYHRSFDINGYKPLEKGTFSLEFDREKQTGRKFSDSTKLRYLVKSSERPNFDLREGYPDRYIKMDRSMKEGLSHMLEWILKENYVLQPGTFVGRRGYLTKILTTPYENNEGWLLAVSLFNGTYYFREMETEAARRFKETRNARLEEMTYWGYKFEHYMCTDEPNGKPNTKGVVNSNEGYYTVVESKINEHTLLFSGEVDCKNETPLYQTAPSYYVELKTNAKLVNQNKNYQFRRYKLLKWWAQSFLAGVPLIVAGFRTEDGIVKETKPYKTSEIPALAAADSRSWKPTTCMEFINAFLSFIKSEVTQDDPGVVYLFSWEPKDDVSYTVHRDPKYTFLHDWYVEGMTKRARV